MKPAVPPPDPAVVKQVEDTKAAVAEAERKAKEAGQLAADAEASRAAAVATAADLERKVPLRAVLDAQPLDGDLQLPVLRLRAVA